MAAGADFCYLRDLQLKKRASQRRLDCLDRFDSDGVLRDWQGYDWDGFDEDGFDKDGFDRDGFGRDGRNKWGLSRDDY